MDTLTITATKNWVGHFTVHVEKHADELTQLDRLAGDGDYGANLRSASHRINRNLEDRPATSVPAVFTAVADAFLDTGGTSGPLFGFWFNEFAKLTTTDVTAKELGVAAAAAAAGVQRLGGAKVGDKTMVDAMVPAAQALTEAADRHATLTEALAEAASAAHRGAMSTQQMLPHRGRASYVAAEHALGLTDPGALTVALFFDAATVNSSPQEMAMGLVNR